MAEFTYEYPNNEDFYFAIKAIVKSQYSHDNNLCEVVNAGYCEFYGTTDFSQRRWNAYSAEVHFFIPISIYSKHNSTMYELMKITLLDICKQIMPPEAGYDIMKVTISPDLTTKSKKDALNEIKKIIEEKNYINIGDELIEKGKKMANAYISLYVLENYIRQYIDMKLTMSVGHGYMDAVIIPQKMKKNLDSRKNQEREKKWLPLRGENDLYYLDFIDLADFIVNNWDYFKNDIPSQEWIKVKMEELYGVRCLIAHNSYISDDNFKLLDVNTKQILTQLG